MYIIIIKSICSVKKKKGAEDGFLHPVNHDRYIRAS